MYTLINGRFYIVALLNIIGLLVLPTYPLAFYQVVADSFLAKLNYFIFIEWHSVNAVEPH